MRALAEKVGARLKARGAVLVPAESCAGGWAAQELTAIAGSSAWFERGFVTYSNEAKQELLGVRAETIKRYAAVSEETAREIAVGALERSPGTMALAITRIVVPSDGSHGKPVGTVCFAWAAKGRTAIAQTRHFNGDREAVR